MVCAAPRNRLHGTSSEDRAAPNSNHIAGGTLSRPARVSPPGLGFWNLANPASDPSDNRAPALRHDALQPPLRQDIIMKKPKVRKAAKSIRKAKKTKLARKTKGKSNFTVNEAATAFAGRGYRQNQQKRQRKG